MGACVIGDADRAGSPLDGARLDVESSVAVADGLTPVVVSVWGQANTSLTLQVRRAVFASSLSDIDGEDRVTVTLADVDGEGYAQVSLVTASPGVAIVSLPLAPAEESVEVQFEPVQITFTEAVAIDRRPGLVIHSVCAVANTTQGRLVLEARHPGESVLPADVLLESPYTLLDGCERAALDVPGVAGVAAFHWIDRDGSGEIDVAYPRLPGRTAGAGTHTRARGPSSPATRWPAQRVESAGGWASLSVQLQYRKSAELEAAPAAGAGLGRVHSVPAGLELVGHSAGDGLGQPETDADGWVTMYFELHDGAEQHSVFATPPGAGTLHLGTVGRSQTD